MSHHGGEGSDTSLLSENPSHTDIDDDLLFEDWSQVPDEQIWDGLPKKYRIKKKNIYIRNHSDLKMIRGSTKFYYLMWKNWKTLKRRWISSLFEALSPVLAVSFIVTYVFLVESNTDTDTRYQPFSIKTHAHAFRECQEFIFIHDKNDLKNEVTDEFVTQLKKELEKELPHKKFRKQDNFKPIENKGSFNDICAVVEFDNVVENKEKTKKTIQYTIRMPAIHPSKTSAKEGLGGFLFQGAQWNTHLFYSDRLVVGPREMEDETGGEPGYFYQGFLYLQNLIDEKIMKLIYVYHFTIFGTLEEAEETFATLLNGFIVRLRRQAFPTFKDHYTVESIHELLPIVLVVAYLIPVMLMVWGTITEKELGIRMQMRSIGISVSSHRMAWLLRCLIIHTPQTIITTAILATDWSYKKKGFLTYTEPSVFGLMLITYVWQTVCTVILFNTFFRKASTATVTAGFFWFATYIPYYYVKSHYSTLSFAIRFFACLMGNTGISLGCHLISEAEGTGYGITLSTIFTHESLHSGRNPNERVKFTIGWVIMIMFVNGLLQVLLAGYVSRLNPDKGNIPLPWNFLFKWWFWNNDFPPSQIIIGPALLHVRSMEQKFPENFETQNRIKRRKELALENVSKYFGLERALHRINLDCYEGHATVIIGEKHSGKSTLLSVIAGLIPWTHGSIEVSRQDLAKKKDFARAFVGFCPAENKLYPYLTVDETLHMYVSLKAIISRLEAWDEVERFLTFSMLSEYRHSLVKNLTPSAQRVLMIGCAFIGGSRVVLLDQPTVHMSSGQKRMVWTFIEHMKKHRTILIAMDNMNESEEIADRIVYLDHGEVRVNGSTPFLQKKFNGGYHLLIEKTPLCDVEAITDIVSKRVPSYTTEDTETQLDVYLPDEDSAAFPGLFQELEKRPWLFGNKPVESYYFTMDEVLLNIKRSATDADFEINDRQRLYQQTGEVNVDEDYKRVSCIPHYCLQLKELFLKNMRFTVRRRVALAVSFFVPLICCAFSIFALIPRAFHENPIELKLTLEPYPHSGIILDCSEATYHGKLLCSNIDLVTNSTFKPKNITVLTQTSKPMNDLILDLYRNKSFPNHQIPHIGIEVKKSKSFPRSNVEVTGYFSNQPLHLPPVVLGLIDNAMMDYTLGKVHKLFPDLNKNDTLPKNISIVRNYEIITSNHPLPYSHSDKIRFSGLLFSPGYLVGFLHSLGYSFLITNFIVMPVKEKDFRHIQYLSGAHPFIFWFSHYFWNFFYFSIVAVLNTCILFGGVHIMEGFYMWDRLSIVGHFFVLLEVYGVCSVMFMGAWSLLPFSHWQLAVSHTFLLQILTGPLMMLMLIAVSDQGVNLSVTATAVLHNFFLFFPNYSLGIGTFYIFANAQHHTECAKYEDFQKHGKKKCTENITFLREFEEVGGDKSAFFSCCYNKRPSQYDLLAFGIGRNLMWMGVMIVISLFVRILKESSIWISCELCIARWQLKRTNWYEYNEKRIFDYDVLTEAVKVSQSQTPDDLVIKNLSKESPGSRNICNLFLELKKGECFCLLGAKGAGKKITLEVISGKVFPTGGDISINGNSLMRNYRNYITKVGYCPDQAAFLDELTGAETLRLIGVLRRIPLHILDGLITNVSLRLLFIHDLENLIERYNPVSLKKLSAAVAMLGYPELVLFNEPTIGVDLLSKEYIFKSIRNLMSKGSIVIIASQSIAECEPVCTKLSIMVNGNLRCFGTPDHIKSNFSEGFTIIVKLNLDPKKIYFTTKADRHRVHERKLDPVDEEELEEEMPAQFFDETEVEAGPIEVIGIEELKLTTWEEDLLQFMVYFEKNFPYAILVDKHPGFIHYHIRPGKCSASTLFAKLEESKSVVAHIKQYYIAKANLDQVLTNFVAGQRPYE